LARSDTAYLVAELDGLVAGFLSLEFRVRLNRSAPEAWIPDLIVTASARDHGCGKALLQAAFILARERGCRRVTLESGYSRTVAHHLYTSAGMQNEGYFFGRVLE
ncbi:MAG: GNAT family N-acetyltransferase, partial [Chloroflexi bacterium]|nr:GNAT family N-acetyltransferase [Chloroflexota bacterium]